MSRDTEHTFSEQIRDRALQAYILPARRAGKSRVSIAVRELMRDLPEFAKGRQSIFCSALIAKPFQTLNGLSLEQMDGPAKKRGTSVVYHYKLHPPAHRKDAVPVDAEGAVRMAERLLAPLRGLLAKEIAERGGVEGYMRWVRSDQPTV